MINQILSYLISPELQETLFPIRVVFSVFFIFFFTGTLWFFFKTSWFRKIFWQDFVEVLTYKGYWRREAKVKWKQIVKKFKKGHESDHKLAVVEADKMLNEALIQRGYGGDSLGERLDQIKDDTLSDMESVKKAHRVSSAILRDPNYKLSLDQAGKALDIYRKAFRDLELF